MPKKKNKGNKLARMNDEERARYLQHRAELELEAKRRKQQLIAVFAKYKLKREEAFSRLNTAKLNEQWRYMLRKIKCKQLYQEIETLSNRFNQTLNVKNSTIKKLYKQLEIQDLDHRRSQEAHIDVMDSIIQRHDQSVQSMLEIYLKEFYFVQSNAISAKDKLSVNVREDCTRIDNALVSWQNVVRQKLLETKTRNSVHVRGIVDLRNKTISNMIQRIVQEMKHLGTELDRILSNYDENSDIKKRQLFVQDTEIVQHSHLQESIGKFKLQLQDLSTKRNHAIAQLYRENQKMLLQISKTKENFVNDRNLDVTQLKKLTVVGNHVIEDLKETLKKSTALKSLWKMCSTLEPSPSRIKSFFLTKTEEEFQQLPTNDQPYDKLDKFWKEYNLVKSGNIILKKQFHQLTLQNKQLKNTLHSTLGKNSPADR